MKTILIAAGLILTGLLAFAQDDPGKEAKRIGVYDSRAIAVAFVGSKVYEATEGKELAARMEEHKKAKAEGNQKKVDELEAWGKAKQELLHRQGFSTAPVDNILAQIKKKLPGIQAKAKVTVLVSKWDAKRLEKHPQAEKIDVTMALVDAFEPVAKQRKSAIEIQKQDPIPLEKMKPHKD